MKKLYYTLAYLLLLGLPSWVFLNYVNLNIKVVIITVIVVMIVGASFDIWAVKQGRKDKFFIWEYNKNSIIGVKIFGVPIEDYVFFLILTPIFIISLYKFIELFI